MNERHDEERLKSGLARQCQSRGGQAKIAKALGVHSSSVKRWLEGERIPTQALKLLRLYLLGEDPFSGQGGGADFQALLGFSAEEWSHVEIQAHRAGQKEPVWMRSQILAFLAFSEKCRAS